jgi:DNA-binding transcriptional regulator YbjK
MSELKLRRLTEHNQRLREDLARPRVRVSEASTRRVFVLGYQSHLIVFFISVSFDIARQQKITL